MAKRQSTNRKRDSDRSGFTELEKNLVRDHGSLVAPDEFDSPPPSSIPLGGEGEVNRGDMRSDYESYDTPEGNKIRTQFVTASGGIRYEQKSYKSGETTHNGFFYVVGSNDSVTVTADPQITRASHGDKLTIQSIGSTITLQNGSGLALRELASMTSGFILNLIYNGTDNLWHETSRGVGF